MREIKLIKSADIFPVIKEILCDGTNVWITVTGMSMYPFLRENLDSVKLSKTSFDAIRKGDIVLIKRKSGEYILHRVLKKEKGHFYIVGDAQKWIEGPLQPEQLIAAVTEIKRKDHQFSCQNSWWKFLVGFWINIIPFRNYFIKAIRVFLKLKKYLKPAQTL
ncbi:MAG: putative transcriptional regulator [Eubacterium sp.]|jgi:hypothetical protein|nr:putative transcriptional regulator [Eubacterium sp.]